ncbi:hypothetical protein BD626DRAFT_407274 [Schizophyllum amplum]|uniref:Uncharacterized protein n=1 Tax=Schizophyllum amplum TaxID=97359 RepID=A0A550C739_9AGAR|nr:hypothetical protein BD626DRAFT_407274 [Auriculariopsis ampla]
MSNAPANTTHAAYDQGIGRAASPADSIGTKYAEDQTTYSEDEMDSETFERRVMKKIRLDDPRPQEEAIKPPLIPRTQGNVDYSYFAVTQALRQRVQALEDEAVFERILLRGPRHALDSVEVQPSSDDIDTLMRNMMVTPDATARQRMAKGPWNDNGALNPSREANRQELPELKHSFASGGTASTAKRSNAKGKGKARQ